MIKKTILLILMALWTATAAGQQECAFILEESQELFDAGLIEDIPERLEGCLEKGFTREEKLQAYKLVILSYLFDDNIEQADAYMARFLDDFPAYEPVATDPKEFVLLLETYDREPLLAVGGGMGSGLSFAYPVERLGTHNTEQHKGSYVPGRAGFHLGAVATRKITPSWRVSAEFHFSNVAFHHSLTNEPDGGGFIGEITEFTRLVYEEVQNWIEVPLGVEYYPFLSGLRPYLEAGIAPGLLLTATAQGERSYTQTGDIRYDPITVSNVNVSGLRRRMSGWAYAGGGVQYHFGTGILYLNLRYRFNLLNQSKPGVNDYENQELLWEVYYVPDDILLNHVTATVGFLLPVYRPKKIEQ